jgi:hypothetical protein
VHGVDTWQAVHEGMRLAAARIKCLEENGWAFYFERSDEKAAASDLFSWWMNVLTNASSRRVETHARLKHGVSQHGTRDNIGVHALCVGTLGFLLVQSDRSWVVGFVAAVSFFGAMFVAAIYFVHYRNALQKFRGGSRAGCE